MTIRVVPWGVLFAAAALLLGSGVTPTISADGRRSGESDGRSLDRDSERDNDHRRLRHVFVIVLENEGFDTGEHLGAAGQPRLLGFFGAVTSDISTRHF
jgi:hypothetical protein